MSYAIANDVFVRLGRPATSSAETSQVNAWLTDVEALISDRFRRAGRNLATDIQTGDVLQATVVRIEAAAVVRKAKNPDGLTSVTRSIDDGSVTTRREGEGVGDELELTEAEWSALLPVAEAGAFTVRPSFTPDCRWPRPWTSSCP